MRFQLPQFIETEVKIVGPFTLKQFLWVAGGVALLFLSYTTIKNITIFVTVAIPIVLIFGSLAFLKIDGLPLIEYLAFYLSYLLNPKRYLFRKDDQGKSEYQNPKS